MHRVSLAWASAEAIVIATCFAAVGAGQSPAPSAIPASCSHPPITCAAPFANGSQVHINVAPTPDGTSCWFVPQYPLDLRTAIDGDAEWQFCSTCGFDTKIDLRDKNN